MSKSPPRRRWVERRYKVTHGNVIPRPSYRGVYPWRKLKARGDRFFVPIGDARNEAVVSAAHQARRRWGLHVTTRIEIEQGVIGTAVYLSRA